MPTAKSKSVLKLIADLELTGVEAAQQKLRRASGEFRDAISFDDKEFLRGWGKARSEISKTWASTVKAAAEASFSPGMLRKVVGQYEASMKKIDASHLKVEHLAAQIRERQAKGLETRQLRTEAAIEKKKFDALRRGFDQEMKHVREVSDRRRDAVEEAERLSKRSLSESAEEFGESLGEHFEKIKSGDISGLLKAAGRRISTGGVQAGQKAGETTGAKSKAFEGISQVLGKLGPAVVALGAVAAGIAAVIKIMIDADAKAKELNRTLLESGAAVGDLTVAYSSAGDAIDRTRRAFVGGEGAFAFNRIWGTTADDHLKVLGAYAEAGLTLQKLARGTKTAGEEMERYRDATAHALTFSKLLGVSTNEVAAATAGYMEDLGLSLQGVQNRFAEVELAARESGFGTKRFFTTILQATSGLTGYNVRLNQAASLLRTIGKVLGPRAGGELLAQLQKGFGGESIQDRYRRLLITGGKTTGRVYKAEATGAVEELAKRVAEASAPQQAAVARSLKAFGVDLAGGKAAAQFGKLSAGQQAGLLGKARLEGVTDELVQVIRTAVATSRGAAGGLATRAGELGNIGAGGTLALKLLEAQRITGAPLHKLQGPAAIAAQNITGITGEEFTQLVKLSESFADTEKRLEEVQAAVRQGKPYDEKLAEQMARAFGIYVDKEGKRRRTLVPTGGTFTAGQGEVVGNTFEDIITSAGKEFEKVAEAQVPRDIQLAQEVVRNTTDITKILEQGVEWWLEQIYSVVQGIFNFLGSAKDQKNRAAALETVTGEIDKARTELRVRERELSDLSARLKGSSGTSRDKIAAELEGKRGAVTTLQGKIEALGKARSGITSAAPNVLTSRSSDEFIEEALKKNKPAILEAAGRLGISGSFEEVLGKLGLPGGRAPAPPAPFVPAPGSVDPAVQALQEHVDRQRNPLAHSRSSKTTVNNFYNNAQSISNALKRSEQANRVPGS